ncbi:YlmH family RNA-binding protein [Paenibacillus marinisediminis]
MSQHEPLFHHFHSDERAFAERAMEWVQRAADRHEIRITGFLDPRQISILQSLVNRNPDVHVRFDGGWADAERKRACIAPDYVYLEAESMGLQVLAVHSADQKWLELEHGDFMGAVLGLGIKREKIGDIHVHDHGCHIVVTEDIASFLDTHLRQVHRVSVMTDVIPITELQPVHTELKEVQLFVASMRLDGIASDMFRLSRTKIVVPIRAGRCKVNWKTVEDPAELLKSGDVVSLKGFGRFKVMEVTGISKSGRIRVTAGIYL